MLCMVSLVWLPSARAQAPVLSSYPSAAAVIFLDFDGQTVTGSTWNALRNPLICQPSNLSNNAIIEIFNRVAEDYRPFNINITTDSTRYFAAPLKKRTRVIITRTHDWYPGVGGVAFPGSFIWGDDTPCFVFSAALGNRPKWIAEAISHEAGHTLGLDHKAKWDENCNRIEDYNTGLGTGEIGWAPIMGIGYYKNFTLWHKGPGYLNCNSVQSDLDVITSASNGFGYRADDHGSAPATATKPVFSDGQFEVTGVIEKNTDEDYFQFIMPASGRFELDAVPYNVGTGNAGSDLDLQVTLFDDHNTVLSVYNPGALLNSVADTLLNAGTYYLKIEGKGNLYAPEYASLGSYSMHARITTSEQPLALHRLELKGWQDGDQHTFSWYVEAEENITAQFIEIATDGRNFVPLSDIIAPARSFTYRPGSIARAQYRLRVEFDNGRRYYSNVVTISEADLRNRPHVVSNVINSTRFNVSSPGNHRYTVYDSHGRTLSSGALSIGVNTITVNAMRTGLYFVRFNDDQQQWTDKLLVQ